MKPKAIIYYNQLTEDAQSDESDVLEQASMAEKALISLGYETIQLGFSFNLEKVIKEIRDYQPALIFNLVESIENNGEFCYFAPAIFNFLNIPYTGTRLESMFNTTSKILAKELFRAKDIPTPDWFSMDQLDELKPEKQYILKPAWEEGSLGLDEHCVFRGDEKQKIEQFRSYRIGHFFVEELIDGREFNISVLGGLEEPEVLPIAEMQFIDFPDEKPRIMGYTAKWDEDSFEYKNTRRTFEFSADDLPLRERLTDIAIQCWKRLNMHGYIRVDIRVDKDGNPYVLEINTNPCLSENGGFYAAAGKKDYGPFEIIQRIVADAFK